MNSQTIRNIIIIIVVIPVSVIVDRITKLLVMANMALGESIPSGGSFISLYYTRNEGVAFSLFDGAGARWLLVGIQSLLVVAIIIIMIVAVKRGARSITLFAISLMLGGGIGNLIDRVTYGSVVDFVGIGSFPVFNFADSCLTVGCVILIIYMIFFQSRVQNER